MLTEASAFCGFREAATPLQRAHVHRALLDQLSLPPTGSAHNTDMAQCWERLSFLKTIISKKLCSVYVPKRARANVLKALKNTLYCTSTFHQMCVWQINPASWEEEQFFSILAFMRTSTVPHDFSETYNHYAVQTQRNASIFIITLATNRGTQQLVLLD